VHGAVRARRGACTATADAHHGIVPYECVFSTMRPRAHHGIVPYECVFSTMQSRAHHGIVPYERVFSAMRPRATAWTPDDVMHGRAFSPIHSPDVEMLSG
jgi:hypothetical protein